MSLLDRFRPAPALPTVPEKCPACKCVGHVEKDPAADHRFFCSVCAKDFHAELDGDGDWCFNLTPRRYLARAHAATPQTDRA